ncbi:MAG: ATP-dependent RNA helicase [Myxococcales bacterium]|nr:ATP-dependent RNA helicase [Myxococcales bacterium]
MSERLPIDDLRSAFEARLSQGPVVVSAPTGSGKSTQIPRWLRARGRVLIIEPRRVACRSLAQRVAHLEGSPLGQAVGYRVRDDDRACAATEVLFVTPGVALRMLADGQADGWPTLVIDEFHERSLDTDLLLALAQDRHPGALVVMSATLEGDRVAAHLGGAHLAGEGRLHPVDIRHRDDGRTLPHDRDLPGRVGAAIDAAAGDPGDVLVFLPGKAEIGACASRLAGRRDLTVVPLHGGLTLAEQAQAFEPAPRRKVILATNVAETSLTLPGIGVVIDTGLVRRTRYHNGRGFLTLMPVAQDSADQRAGRAGRLGPGVCYRLWAQRARLDAHTPPEIHRESLVPLLMGAAACGARVDTLPFIDPPKPHAVQAAREELQALDALDPDDGLAPVGQVLFGLPLDAPLGRLLVEARDRGDVLPEMVDLVAVLAVGRPLWRPGPPPQDPVDDLRDGGCDATAFIRAVREGDPDRHGLRPFTLAEARRIAQRLRQAFGLGRPEPGRAIDRRALALTALAADRRLAHVIRRRKKEIAWSNGGTELELGRDCALNRVLEGPEGRHVEACVVFESRALGLDERRTAILITCAMPVPLPWLVAAEVGRERVGQVQVDKAGPRLVAVVERIHARKVLTSYEVVPRGELARQALAQAFLEGRLWRDTLAATRERLEARALHARLQAGAGEAPTDVPDLEAWVHATVAALGLESGDDLALMSPADLLADDLPAWDREALDRDFPRRIEYRDARFEVRYDLRRRWVHLDQVDGSRKDPPPVQWLPTFKGFGVEWHRRNHSRVLKPRP